MTAGLVLLGTVSLIVAAYFFLLRKHKSNYLALAEYWVFLPGTKLPEQERIMDRMLRGNPYSRRGLSPITHNEGLVFSDVRLHIALVLRSKNPHIFRPDLFEEHIVPTPEVLESLKQAQSMVKLRFASEIPLRNKTHLQFLLHAADAVADLGGGSVIFDVKAEKLMDRQEVEDDLKANFDATGYLIHTQVIWRRTAAGGVAETRGLGKIGLADLRTGEMEPDQRVIATNVMTEAIRCIWDNGDLPESVEVVSFDDTFKVQFEKMKNALTKVRILRVQIS